MLPSNTLPPVIPHGEPGFGERGPMFSLSLPLSEVYLDTLLECCASRPGFPHLPRANHSSPRNG